MKTNMNELNLNETEMVNGGFIPKDLISDVMFIVVG